MLLVLALPAAAQTGRVLPVCTAENLAPRQLRLTVTWYNAGATLPLDYTAFLHFDLDEAGERLVNQPEPGLRPLVAATTASQWAPNEVTVTPFGPVTVPAGFRRVVYVKAGLWDPKGGTRVPLAGDDGTHRVLLGRLVCEAEACRFERAAPGQVTGEARGVVPRSLVRALAPEPLVRFAEIDPDAWRVEGFDGGEASFRRTREELCWSPAALRVDYHGSGPASGFALRPAQPIPLPADADAAGLWLLGRAVGWLPKADPEQPLLRHWLELTDAAGAVHRAAFRQSIGYPWWYVARVRLPADWPRPLSLTWLGFAGCSNRVERSLILDCLQPLQERPEAPLSTTVDLTDPGFPTSPDGLFPPAPECTTRIEPVEGGWRLISEGGGEQVAWLYRPATGSMEDLGVEWRRGDEVRRPTLTVEGGPTARLGGRVYGPTAGGVRRTQLEAAPRDGRVVSRWRLEAGGEAVEYSLALSLHGRSLAVEVDAAAEGLTGFSPGGYVGGGEARFVWFPYFTWQSYDYGRDGGVVCDGPLFACCFPDWYRSRASAPAFGNPLSHRAEALAGGLLEYAPAMHYQTRSDGHRNPLRERFIYTVASEVGEVLPSIAHRPSPNRDKLAGLCHHTGGQASRLAGQLDHWTRLHGYGVTGVYQRHFDGMWADDSQGPQEWTLAEHAAPAVGDVAVRQYLDQLRAMGYFPVLYTNYTDLQPVSAEFAWDRVNRLPDGDISDWCWPGSYPLKPLRAVELEAKYAPRIAARFGSQGSFCDVHTAAAPWGKVDFDARLPGAAEYGTTYRCYGKLLQHEREVYGAVYSEGSIHWLYAGLADGSDAQIHAPQPWREPFLVDFDLTRIHPLEMDAGMSWLSRYVESAEDAAELGGWEAAQDRFTAATIAYGHQGTFTDLSFRGAPADVKTFYLLGPLQRRYAMRRAAAIAYHDAATGRLLGTSDAVRSEVYRESQVYVRYESGLEVWVNGSLGREWAVEVGGRTYRLQQASGFVARGPDGVLVYSAVGEKGRADYASDGPVRFVDARGVRQVVGEVETDGMVIVRRVDAGWTVMPVGQVSVLRLDAKALGLPAEAKVTGYDADGNGAPVAATMADGWLQLPVGGETVRFEVR